MVGASEEVRSAGGGEVIDAAGRLVLPGFIDTHTCFVNRAFRLSSCRSGASVAC
jgi:predicted amidohydrolase YtcJ